MAARLFFAALMRSDVTQNNRNHTLCFVHFRFFFHVATLDDSGSNVIGHFAVNI